MHGNSPKRRSSLVGLRSVHLTFVPDEEVGGVQRVWEAQCGLSSDEGLAGWLASEAGWIPSSVLWRESMWKLVIEAWFESQSQASPYPQTLAEAQRGEDLGKGPDADGDSMLHIMQKGSAPA